MAKKIRMGGKINQTLMRSIMSMIPPEQIAGIFDRVPELIAGILEKYKIKEGEKFLAIMLVENEKQMFATIAAFNHDDKVVRQLQTIPVKDLIMNMIKPIENGISEQ